MVFVVSGQEVKEEARLVEDSEQDDDLSDQVGSNEQSEGRGERRMRIVLLRRFSLFVLRLDLHLACEIIFVPGLLSKM